MFSWDTRKAITNFEKHGVSFEEAATVFHDRLHGTVYDGVHSEDEVRWLTIGYSSERRLIVVSHTDRGNKIRLISARRPTRTQRETYERG